MAKILPTLIILFAFINSDLFCQDLVEEISDLLISMNKNPESIDVSETPNGYVLDVIYLNSVTDIKEAENMYFESVIRAIRSTMSNVIYSLYVDRRDLFHTVTITAKDSMGNYILRTYFFENPNNRINWQALEHLVKRGIADRWQTFMYSHKNEIWFDVPESVIISRYYN